MNEVKIINKTRGKVNVGIEKINGNIQVIIDVSSKKESLITKERKLSMFAPGDVFEKNGVKYIVCEHLNSDFTAVVRKECLKECMKFGDINNWAKSDVRKFLNNEYLKNISVVFGWDNILPHEVDLLSLDGYDDYGKTIDKVSVLTIDRYRKYHKIIGNTRDNWLSTPDSTPSGIGNYCVQHANNGGDINWNLSYSYSGVRPFFILKSDISVSLEN